MIIIFLIIYVKFALLNFYSLNNLSKTSSLKQDTLSARKKENSNNFIMIDGKINAHIKYWPNHKVRYLVLFDTDSACQKLSFNIVGKLISRVEGKFLNGQLVYNGKGYYFSDSGKLVNIYSYKEGKFHGEYRSFYENGFPYLIGEYRNDKEVGTWITFDKVGRVISKQKFK